MFLAPGQIVTLREIMLGLAVSSGNDAAVAAARRIAPSVDEFAAMMTAEARRMGLNVPVLSNRPVFRNLT
jgi:D-alanyl-D-alanine carboxypeptidase (penicillin-binding protein 5/6)